MKYNLIAEFVSAVGLFIRFAYNAYRKDVLDIRAT